MVVVMALLVMGSEVVVFIVVVEVVWGSRNGPRKMKFVQLGNEPLKLWNCKPISSDSPAK